MNKYIPGLFHVCIFSYLAIGPVQSAVAAEYTDGIFSGESQGMKLSVSILENRLENISILEDISPPAYHDKIQSLIPGILETQNPNVDGISGATRSCQNFREALQDALNQSAKEPPPLNLDIYNFSVQTIDGEAKEMKDYRGQVLLIVNTASRCGYTPQYRSLEVLYQRFKARGFAVLAFPANNFRNQEPGNNEEIKNFCFRNYKTSFPLFSKISVSGDDIHPLYAYLTSATQFPGPITWNFNKFLVNPRGEVVARFETPTDPLSKEVIQAITDLLPGP